MLSFTILDFIVLSLGIIWLGVNSTGESCTVLFIFIFHSYDVLEYRFCGHSMGVIPWPRFDPSSEVLLCFVCVLWFSMGISFRCKPFSITLLTYFLIFLFYLFFLFHDYFVCGDFMNIKILDTTLRDGEQTS